MAEATGRFNCLHKPLVDAQKVFLPPFHLKLGLMKKKKRNFVTCTTDGAASMVGRQIIYSTSKEFALKL